MDKRASERRRAIHQMTEESMEVLSTDHRPHRRVMSRHVCLLTESGAQRQRR